MERGSTRKHENATADPSAAPQNDSAKGDDATYLEGSGHGEYSGQSEMERCSTRNHENARADPSTALAAKPAANLAGWQHFLDVNCRYRGLTPCNSHQSNASMRG